MHFEKYLLACLFLIIIPIVGVFAQCDVKNTVFQSGEKVTYNVYYKLGFMWFNAAKVSFNVNPSSYNNQKAFYFKSYGQTLPNYDWIFKVRDTYYSIVDSATLRPLYFSRQTHEGSQWVNNQYKFDQGKRKIYSTIENNSTKKYYDTIPLTGCVYDVLSAVYACRNFNVTNIKPNDTLPISMVIDNKIYRLYLRYLNKEIAALNDNIAYRCNKFAILMVGGTIFSGGEDVTVWISDDNAKIPIKVEAKILAGSIIAQVDTIDKSLYPLQSIVRPNLPEK